MLTQHDLLGTNSIFNISDISLKLYKSFFDDIQLKLAFQETHLLHILGAQHILGQNYKASKFNDEINSGTMTFEVLEKRNNIVFNDFTDRFLSFSNLYHLLTNCSLIYFDKETYSSSKTSQMDFSHILYIDLENKKIHAGLDTFNKGHSFYCKSLLVTSIYNDKIIHGQIPIAINRINVLDKKTNLGGQAVDLKEYSNMDKLRSLSKDGNELSVEQIKAIYLFMKDKVKKGSLDKNDPTFILLSEINNELNNKLPVNQSSQGIKFDNSSDDMRLR